MEALGSWAAENHLLLLLAAGTVFTAVWLLLMRERLHMKPYAIIIIALLHTLIGVAAVKIFAFMETGFDAESLGNMSLFGGVFMMPLIYLLGAKLFKRPSGEVCDIFTPCMIFTVMCARVNCIISGCCIGLPIPGTDGLRYPTREAELLFYVILLLCLIPRVKNGKTKGSAYPVYMICYGAFRFVVEFFRYSSSTDALFHLSHVWALISLLIGISVYAEVIKSNSKANSKPKRRRKT